MRSIGPRAIKIQAVTQKDLIIITVKKRNSIRKRPRLRRLPSTIVVDKEKVDF